MRQALPSSQATQISLLWAAINDLRKRSALFGATLSTGSLTIRDAGSLVLIGPDGTELILNPADSIGPEMRLLPSADPTNYGSILGYQDEPGRAQIYITSSGDVDNPDGLRSQLVVSPDVIGISTVDADGNHSGGTATCSPSETIVGMVVDFAHHIDLAGGVFQADANTALVGVRGAASDLDSLFQFDSTFGETSHLGIWQNNEDIGPEQGLYPIYLTGGTAGDTDVVISYGTTKNSVPAPLVGLVDTVINAVTITANDASGFTASWATPAGAGYALVAWVFRV